MLILMLIYFPKLLQNIWFTMIHKCHTAHHQRTLVIIKTNIKGANIKWFKVMNESMKSFSHTDYNYKLTSVCVFLLAHCCCNIINYQKPLSLAKPYVNFVEAFVLIVMVCTHHGTRGCTVGWIWQSCSSSGRAEWTNTALICSSPPRQRQERRWKWTSSGGPGPLGQYRLSSGKKKLYWRKWLALPHTGGLRREERKTMRKNNFQWWFRLAGYKINYAKYISHYWSFTQVRCNF